MNFLCVYAELCFNLMETFGDDMERVSNLPGAEFFGMMDKCDHPNENCQNCMDIETFILSNKQHVNDRYLLGTTFMQSAVDRNNKQIVKFLLKNGACPNSLTQTWCCPILSAVKSKNEDIVKLLIDHNADIEILLFFCVDIDAYNNTFPDSELIWKLVNMMTLDEITSMKTTVGGGDLSQKLETRKCELIGCICDKFSDKDNEFMINHVGSYL